MKKVVHYILRCIKSSKLSGTDHFREYPKLMELGLEANGTHPMQKAAFALHYFCCDINDSQSKPVFVVEGVMHYLKDNGYTWNDTESMYEELKLAFSNNETAVDIENILENYMQRNPN